MADCGVGLSVAWAQRLERFYLQCNWVAGKSKLSIGNHILYAYRRTESIILVEVLVLCRTILRYEDRHY
jgi:hypothetical protein